MYKKSLKKVVCTKVTACRREAYLEKTFECSDITQNEQENYIFECFLVFFFKFWHLFKFNQYVYT